jgi:hypothetical protein
METVDVAKIRYHRQSLTPTRTQLSLYTGPQPFCMSQSSSADGKEEFVSVKKSDLERIMALLSRLENQEL